MNDPSSSEKPSAVKAGGAPAGPVEKTLDDAIPPGSVAVLVCHGMGQQVPFATLTDVAEAIRVAHDKKYQPHDDSTSEVEFARVGGIQLPRARLRLGEPKRPNPEFKDREIHLYEAYWAEKSAGQISGSATLWFLLTAGANGLHFAVRRTFRRWMFGGERDCALAATTMFSLAVTLVVLLSLLSIVLCYGVIVFANVAMRFDIAWDSTIIRVLQPRFLATLLPFVSASLLYAFVLWMARHQSWITRAANVLYGTAALVTIVISGAGSAYLMLKAWDNGGSTHGLLQSLVGWAETTALASRVSASASALFGQYVALFTPNATGIFAAPRAIASGLFWIGFPAALLLARYFLVEYVGDVAIYLSAHKVNRYAEVRRRIEEECSRVAKAVYEAGEWNGYKEIYVVGHSLGSVLAYDTINRLVCDKSIGSAKKQVIDRTPLLLTFGSPLDKVAFLFRAQATEFHERSALLAARQPLIRNYDYRPKRWVNLWTRYDWISGSLSYYDQSTEDLQEEHPEHLGKQVRNIVDEAAFVPLIAHTGYWTSEVFRSTLYQALQGHAASETDAQGDQTHSAVGAILRKTNES